MFKSPTCAKCNIDRGWFELQSRNGFGLLCNPNHQGVIGAHEWRDGMTTEEAIRRIQYAPECTQEEVSEAIKECLEGAHGEFVKQTLEALIQAYELGKEHGQ